MPRAEIATKQAKFTLEQLHAELGGKILDNKAEAKRLAIAMMHVEAVLIRPILGQHIEQPVEEPEGGPPRITEPDTSERARIIGLLGPAPVSIDDLVRLSQSSPAIVRTVLLELEITGRLERQGGGLVSLL